MVPLAVREVEVKENTVTGTTLFLSRRMSTVAAVAAIVALGLAVLSMAAAQPAAAADLHADPAAAAADRQTNPEPPEQNPGSGGGEVAPGEASGSDRSPWVAVAIGAGVLLLIGAVIWWSRRSDPSEEELARRVEREREVPPGPTPM